MPDRDEGQRRAIADDYHQRLDDDQVAAALDVPKEELGAVGLSVLADALRERDAHAVAYGVSFGFSHGFGPGHVPILLALADADWHFRHEDVVSVIDRLRVSRPSTCSCVSEGAQAIRQARFHANRTMKRRRRDSLSSRSVRA